MTDKDLKNIYVYMGWRLAFKSNVLDTNDAWEVVQEIERKGDAGEFDIYLQDSNLADQQFSWLMNPTNFWNCISKWLEVREK